MGFFDFIRKWLRREQTTEHQILQDLKSKSKYDLGKLWENKTLEDLKKLDELLLTLLKILRIR